MDISDKKGGIIWGCEKKRVAMEKDNRGVTEALLNSYGFAICLWFAWRRRK